MAQRHEALEAKLDALLAAFTTFKASVADAKAAGAAEDDAAENPSLQRMTDKIDAAMATFTAAVTEATTPA